MDLSNLLTERRNPYTLDIDKVSSLEMCMLINEEDKKAAVAVRNVLPQIARAVDEIAARLARGGRLFYIGAGTSGRLGILGEKAHGAGLRGRHCGKRQNAVCHRRAGICR